MLSFLGGYNCIRLAFEHILALLETYDIFRGTVCVAGVVGAAHWYQERPQARPQVCYSSGSKLLAISLIALA